MSLQDPLLPLLRHEKLARSHSAASQALNKPYLSPAAMRRFDVISSESILRGARSSAMLAETENTAASDAVGQAISVYSVLAPDRIEATARTFHRVPRQVLATMDVAAGGNGTPVDADKAQRLEVLARLIVGGQADAVLLPQIVHGEIYSHHIFGPRSGLIARAAARVTAVASGSDPRGFIVFEPYLYRHRDKYRRLAQQFGADAQAVREFARFQLQAWIAGSKEAQGIVEAA